MLIRKSVGDRQGKPRHWGSVCIDLTEGELKALLKVRKRNKRHGLVTQYEGNYVYSICVVDDNDAGRHGPPFAPFKALKAGKWVK